MAAAEMAVTKYMPLWWATLVARSSSKDAMAQIKAISAASQMESRKNRTIKNRGANTTATRIRVSKSYPSKPAGAALEGRNSLKELLLGEVGP